MDAGGKIGSGSDPSSQARCHRTAVPSSLATTCEAPRRHLAPGFIASGVIQGGERSLHDPDGGGKRNRQGPDSQKHQSRHTSGLSDTLIKRPRDAWAQWISPETLIALVRNTAPFLEARLRVTEHGRLIELGNSSDGFMRVLANWQNILCASLTPEEQLQSYFALCLACHHGLVATFVPTDVDSKIRGIVWRESRDPAVLRPMLRLALAARAWTEDGISVRSVRGVSGHNGEHWSAIAGGLGRMQELGDTASAEEAQAAIEAEIDREQAVFNEVSAEPDAELDLLRLSMTLAHNRGDLTQGMGFWKKTPQTGPLMEHFATRGRFEVAVRIYQHT